MNWNELDFTHHNCLECKYYCTSRRSLGNHLAKTHTGMKTYDYALKHFYNNEHPKCICGCGEYVEWHKLKYKFNSYVSGHNGNQFSSENQPSLSEEQLLKRISSIKKTYEERGDEIKAKISLSINNILNKDDTYRSKLSNSQKERWKREREKNN